MNTTKQKIGVGVIHVPGSGYHVQAWSQGRRLPVRFAPWGFQGFALLLRTDEQEVSYSRGEAQATARAARARMEQVGWDVRFIALESDETATLEFTRPAEWRAR